MEPRIQYAKTSDGVSIAYAVMGEGTPLVACTTTWGGELHHYTARAGLPNAPVDALIASGFRVLIYDNRGMGSSDRTSIDYTIEARLDDVDAVIAHAGLDRFVLVGNFGGGPPAVVYSIQHPERVTHLVLSNAWAVGAEYFASIPGARVARGMQSMAEDDWDYSTLLLANTALGFTDSERARNLARTYRRGMTSRAFYALEKDSYAIDVSGVLASVCVPALVLYDLALRRAGYGALAQVWARGIPSARLIATNDAAHAIREFVDEGGAASSAHPERGSLPLGMTAILFADIADSTGLTERMGDDAFRQKARELDTSLRAAIRERGGTPVEGKLLGDGVLAVFTSAREAIEAALACGKQGSHAGLPLHLGIHAGDVIRERDPDGRDNVYGGAVNIAARIAGLSAAGEVLVSETVRSLARTSAGVGFKDRGEQALKGVGEKVRVWAVAAAANRQTDKPANQGGA